MKVNVIEWNNGWTIELVQGAQSFLLKYNGTKEDCTWYAKMFRKALKAHNDEFLAKEGL